MKNTGRLTLSGILLLAGCASHASNVEATFVSPAVYDGKSCQLLAEEQQRVQANVRKISDEQNTNANADVALTSVGAVIFWPALIGLAFTKDHKEELGSAKGDDKALTEELRLEHCGVSGPAPALLSPPAVVPAI